MLFFFVCASFLWELLDDGQRRLVDGSPSATCAGEGSLSLRIAGRRWAGISHVGPGAGTPRAAIG